MLPDSVLREIYEYLRRALGVLAEGKLQLNPPVDTWATYQVELKAVDDHCSFDAWAEDEDELRMIVDRRFNAYLPMEFTVHLANVLDAIVDGSILLIELNSNETLLSNGKIVWDRYLVPLEGKNAKVAISSFRPWRE